MTGGSVQPYQPKDGEVLAHLSDGGYYRLADIRDESRREPENSGVGLFQVLSPAAGPVPVYAAEQVERGLAWLRDHYRDGSFRCPSGDEGGNE